MKMLIAKSTYFSAVVAATALATTFTTAAFAGEKLGDIGVGVQFGNSTSFGVEGKIKVTESFSLRPSVYFGVKPGAENKPFNNSYTALTSGAFLSSPYTTPNTGTPSPVAFTPNVAITAGGTTYPAGIAIPAGTVFPAGTVLPTGLIIPPGTYTGGFLPPGFILKDAVSTSTGTGAAQLNYPLTVTTAFNLTAPFTPNVPITAGGTTFPAGTVLPAGTPVPAGTVLPVGLQIPAGTVLPAVQYPSGVLTNDNTGTAYALAATYDFKIDSEGKANGYIGPKVSFANSSGPVTINGVKIPGSNVDVNEAKIGAVVGADYAISENFIIGVNATYNFSRNLNSSLSINGTSADASNLTQSSGSSVDLGIRAAYRF